MLKPNPPGHHTTLTQEKIDEIISYVPQVIVQNHIAGMARIAKQTLSNWLQRGKRDTEEGRTDTLCAQLRDRYIEARAKVVKEKLEFLATCPKNYGALTWILEKCFREDFGVESEEMTLLKNYVFNQIAPIIGKGNQYGRQTEEMDSKSD